MSQRTNQNKRKASSKEAGISFYASPEEQEMARLREAANRTDEEKFHFLMTLMKMQRTMKRGIIHHQS